MCGVWLYDGLQISAQRRQPKISVAHSMVDFAFIILLTLFDQEE